MAARPGAQRGTPRVRARPVARRDGRGAGGAARAGEAGGARAARLRTGPRPARRLGRRTRGPSPETQHDRCCDLRLHYTGRRVGRHNRRLRPLGASRRSGVRRLARRAAVQRIRAVEADRAVTPRHGRARSSGAGLRPGEVVRAVRYRRQGVGDPARRGSRRAPREIAGRARSHDHLVHPTSRHLTAIYAMKQIALAWLLLVLALPAIVRTGQQRPPTEESTFSVFEAGIPEMQAAMKAGRTSSHEIVQQYLTRIALYEDKLNAAITINPDALKDADERDRERGQGRLRGPLHGIPVALKDNIQTTNMPTTGGALAFDGLIPPYEATLTKNLRDAGAIIIAKTGMTELANWVSSNMPGNYNALKGYGMNPYDPRRDPRDATFDGRPAMSTGGSSSGIGTSANFWTANVGTETSGSILSPSNQNMPAGVKPRVGRVSRYGVTPITADQDTPGPMAKSVTDAAIMLGALEGASPDPNDPATKNCTPPPNRDYTQFLKRDGLKGARIGIPRAFYYDKSTPPGADKPRGGLNDDQQKVMKEAIEILTAQGAVIVDPADIPSVVDKDAKNNVLNWGVCTDMDDVKEKKCSIILAYGMERDFNSWLTSLGKAAPVKTLSELRKWNRDHQKLGA